MTNINARTLPIVLVAAVAVFLVHYVEPGWFVAKQHGIGFTPAVWEGWAAIIGIIAATAVAVQVSKDQD